LVAFAPNASIIANRTTEREAIVKQFAWKLRLLFGAVVFVVLVSGTACTPEKASALRALAEQFRVESFAAIDKIQVALNKELEAPPRAPAQVSDEFVNIILSTNMPLKPDIIEKAINPDAISAGPAQDARKALMADLRNQYSSFAAIFDDLERGSYLAGDSVAKTSDLVAKLTEQMSAFAKHFSDNPVHLIQYEDALTVSIQKVRDDNTLTKEQKRDRLLALQDQWAQMRRDEESVNRETIEQCLKAAVLGVELRKRVNDYSKLSIDDLQNITAAAFRTAGSLTGKDLSSLTKEADSVFAKIQGDPVWQSSANSVLAQINTRLTSAGRAEVGK
jgi:hypothetical protein